MTTTRGSVDRFLLLVPWLPLVGREDNGSPLTVEMPLKSFPKLRCTIVSISGGLLLVVVTDGLWFLVVVVVLVQVQVQVQSRCSGNALSSKVQLLLCGCKKEFWWVTD